MKKSLKDQAQALAGSDCDLGDERDVIRTLTAAGLLGNVNAVSDDAIELARSIRAGSNALAVS